jgi:uncharacterized membrane protein YkvA (DUF1232 family)
MADRTAWADAAKQALALAPNLLKLYGRLVADSRVPLRARALALATLGYTASPIDLVPDFVPFLGQIDDIVIVAAGLKRLAEAAGPEIMVEHWDGELPVLESVQSVVEAAAVLAPRPLRTLLERVAPLG